jgi:hypothetical protein
MEKLPSLSFAVPSQCRSRLLVSAATAREMDALHPGRAGVVLYFPLPEPYNCIDVFGWRLTLGGEGNANEFHAEHKG